MALGSLLEATKQSDRAVQIYLQAIQAFPDENPSFPGCHVVRDTAYNRLVTILENQNRLDRVLTIFEQLQPNPTVEMYFNLALALEYQKHPEQAAAIKRRLSEFYPNAEPEKGWRC